MDQVFVARRQIGSTDLTSTANKPTCAMKRLRLKIDGQFVRDILQDR